MNITDIFLLPGFLTTMNALSTSQGAQSWEAVLNARLAQPQPDFLYSCNNCKEEVHWQRCKSNKNKNEGHWMAVVSIISLGLVYCTDFITKVQEVCWQAASAMQLLSVGTRLDQSLQLPHLRLSSASPHHCSPNRCRPACHFEPHHTAHYVRCPHVQEVPPHTM
jgi:hypothetical protein